MLTLTGVTGGCSICQQRILKNDRKKSYRTSCTYPHHPSTDNDQHEAYRYDPAAVRTARYVPTAGVRVDVASGRPHGSGVEAK